MTNCPAGKRFKPLPLRRGFWRELPDKIKGGIVLIAEDEAEGEDIRNAAQSILISDIAPRLMKDFRRPKLESGKEFFEAFFYAYAEEVYAEELRIWEEISDEIDRTLAEQPGRDLTGSEAAYLTYSLLGYEEPPQSFELYMNLAVFARTYEELLRKKYGPEYTAALFYQALREHMPNFLFRLIGMDSVTSALLTLNAKPRETAGETLILQPTTRLESRFMELREDDSFSFRPQFVDMIHEHMRSFGIKEDGQGRTEDRGCPVLYASERSAIVRFSIDQLIAEHESYGHKI
jgi:hypothetical protein